MRLLFVCPLFGGVQALVRLSSVCPLYGVCMRSNLRSMRQGCAAFQGAVSYLMLDRTRSSAGSKLGMSSLVSGRRQTTSVGKVQVGRDGHSLLPQLLSDTG